MSKLGMMMKSVIKIVECLNCDRLTGTYWPRLIGDFKEIHMVTNSIALRVAMRRCPVSLILKLG